jgi:hypothetical protein
MVWRFIHRLDTCAFGQFRQAEPLRTISAKSTHYDPKSGYDNDLEYHFKNCPLDWKRGHLYLRNILRAHSNGSWTWRTEN